MSYVTISDLEKAFGENELLALSDRDNQGEISVSVLEEAIRRAISEAESYLVRRYVLPPVPPPAALVAAICDIVRFRLTGGPVTETDPIKDRYKLAIDWLKRVASGEVILSELVEIAPPGGEIEFSTGQLVWGTARDSQD